MTEVVSFARWWLGLSRRIARLGADAPNRIALLALAVTMPIKQRLGPVRALAVPLRLRHRGRTFRCRLATISDVRALSEIFVERTYAAPIRREVRQIVDLGANIGLSVLYWKLRWPAARVLAVEPDPRGFAQLLSNVRGLDGVVTRQAAVAGTDGELDLYLSPNTWASSLFPVWPGRTPIEVQGRRLDRLLEEAGVRDVDILKLDVEGAELEALRAFSGLSRVGTVLGEYHGELAGATLSDFLDLLEPHFRVVATRPLGRPEPGTDRWLFVARNRRAPYTSTTTGNTIGRRRSRS